MIEELAQCEIGQMISIDNDMVAQITGCEDFVIEEIQNLDYDHQNIVIVNLGSYHLIANDLSNDSECFICELYDSGDEYLDEEMQFIEEIELEGGEDTIIYQFSESIYENIEETKGFCEYRSNDFFDYLAIHKTENDVIVYRGKQIDYDDIIV